MRQRVNRELVELRPVNAEEGDLLHGLLARHQEETGSAVAERLLADWEATLARFTTVMPRDYARVVEVRRAAAAEGLDLDGEIVWKRIMEASNG